MGTQRTSMKDVLAAIEAQNDTLTALVAAIAGQTQAPAPVVTPAPAQVVTPIRPEPEQQALDIPKGYMEHMSLKVAELHANDGQARVLYARRNGHGETKLAYALKTRWDAGLKDKGLIGAVKVFA